MENILKRWPPRVVLKKGVLDEPIESVRQLSAHGRSRDLHGLRCHFKQGGGQGGV